jgi:hypothetical protein
MGVQLANCGKCCRPLDDTLVFTACKNDRGEIVFHIFHNSKDCIADWFKRSVVTCPLCNRELYYNQVGKSLNQLLKIFLNALGVPDDNSIISRPPTVTENDECSVCLDTFPIIRFKDGIFYHDACSPQGAQQLPYIRDFANKISIIVNKHPNLKQQFTPTPPTMLDRIRFEYPLAAKVVVIGIFSLSMVLLNHYKYGGESWILFGLGLPAYLTLIVTRQVGLMTIALLNSRS